MYSIINLQETKINAREENTNWRFHRYGFVVAEKRSILMINGMNAIIDDARSARHK